MSFVQGSKPVIAMYKGNSPLKKMLLGESQVWPSDKIIIDGSRLTLVLTSNLEITLNFQQSVANGISINWGDGSQEETVENTTANPTHTYQEPGLYVIVLYSINGATWIPGGSFSGGSFKNIFNIEGGKGNSSPELTEVVLNNDVSSLGSYAFSDCTNLSKIILPSTLTTISSNAFYKCSELREINLPSSITTLEADCFSNCLSLEELTIPSNVTTISTELCYGCVALKRVALLGAVTIIYGNAFNGCSALEEINFPSTLTGIYTQAFKDCTSLPKNLELFATTIQARVFEGCTQLEKVWLRTTIETINVNETKKSGSVTARYGPFFNCSSSLALYCEPSSRPTGWNEYFDVYTGLDTRLSTQYGVTSRPW